MASADSDARGLWGLLAGRTKPQVRQLRDGLLSPTVRGPGAARWLASKIGAVATGEGAKVAERHGLRHLLVAEFEAEPLLEKRLQLHAAQAVEVQIFGEACGARDVSGNFSGDGGDHLQEHISAASGRMRGGCGELIACPLTDDAAQQLARGGVGEAGLGPAQHATNLLEVGERVVGLLEDLSELGVVSVGEQYRDRLRAIGDLRWQPRLRRERPAA